MHKDTKGLSWWLRWWTICLQYRRPGFDPWVGFDPWAGKIHGEEGNDILTPVFWPGEFHGQKSLAGYSPWGYKESDTTEQLSYIIYKDTKDRDPAGNSLVFKIVLFNLYILNNSCFKFRNREFLNLKVTINLSLSSLHIPSFVLFIVALSLACEFTVHILSVLSFQSWGLWDVTLIQTRVMWNGRSSCWSEPEDNPVFHKERESQGEQSFLQNVSGKVLIT